VEAATLSREGSRWEAVLEAVSIAMNVFPNDLKRLTHRAMAESVLEWLRAHPQLGVSDQNRLSRQCRLIVNSQGIIQKANPDWRHFVQSLRDLQEYWFIVQILGERLLDAPFLDRFAVSLADPVHPADSAGDTPGRDAQFELFLAAIASRAGLGVDRSGQSGADWILTVPTARWSLEAKRVKNLNRVGARVRKAVKQIVISEIGGVIALDISMAVNPDCSPLPEFVPDNAIAGAHEARTNALAQEMLPLIIQRIGRANVGFLLLHDFVICPASTTEKAADSWALIELWSKLDTVTTASSRRAHFDALWQLLEAALPRW